MRAVATFVVVLMVASAYLLGWSVGLADCPACPAAEVDKVGMARDGCVIVFLTNGEVATMCPDDPGAMRELLCGAVAL